MRGEGSAPGERQPLRCIDIMPGDRGGGGDCGQCEFDLEAAAATATDEKHKTNTFSCSVGGAVIPVHLELFA